MRTFRKFLLFISLLIMIFYHIPQCLSQQIQNEGMKFEIRTLDLRPLGMGLHHFIGASGEIKEGDSDRLSSYIYKNNIGRGDIIFLNSAGGFLLESIKMANILRSHGIYTDVGQLASNPEMRSLPGECASACVFLFLGGERRFLHNESNLLIHQWKYSTDELSINNDIAKDEQNFSGHVVEFLQKMGIDPGLLIKMSKIPPEHIEYLTMNDLLRFNIITQPYKTTWSIAPNRGEFTAQSVTADEHGTHDFNFLCSERLASGHRQLLMYIGTDAGTAADSVAQNALGFQIILSSGWVTLTPQEGGNHPPLINPLDHRHVGGVFTVSPRLINLILNSDILGFAILQPRGLYVGFTGSLPPDAKEDIIGIRNSCNR